MDSKGGSWRHAGGMSQPPWLFRRKANPCFITLQDKFDAAAKTAENTYWLYDGVHPTPMGHEIIKNEWLKGFRELTK